MVRVEYPEVENLEQALSYLRESLPQGELQSFLEQARPLAQSLGGSDSSALEQFYGLISTNLYHQLRRDSSAPLEVYSVFADCYELVDAPVEEKMIILKRTRKEYREQQDFRDDVLKTFRE